MESEELPVESSIAAAVGASLANPSGPQASAIRIDPLSVTSLFLKLYSHAGSEQHLSNATGFVVRHRGKHYLVTNWHVLAGRHAETWQPLDKMAALPDQIRIAHLLRGEPGVAKWVFVREPLLKADGSPRWIEHPLGEST